MITIFGTSIIDRLFNASISAGYSAEAAAAMAATISYEGVGADLITFKGERQKRYLGFCTKNKINYRLPDSKIRYFFEELPSNRNYKASELKYSQTVDAAVKTFNTNYLGKTLSATQLLTVVGLANEIYTIFVSNA